MNIEYKYRLSEGKSKDAEHDSQSQQTMFRPTSRLKVACWYAEHWGWTCLPAYGKRPIVPWRDEVMPECPPLETLAELWKPTPNANIAVLTGRRSGLLVGDVDPRHGGKLETLWALGWPPETPIARSGGGGWHVYVACPAEGLASVSGYAQGIELKADGALVIAPPSVHPETQRRYEWLSGCEPWRVPLAPLPQSVLDTLAAYSPQQRSTPKTPELDPDDPRRLVYSQEETLRLTTTLVNWAVRKTRTEHRNNVAYLLGQQLDSLGLTRREIAAIAALYERMVRNV